MENFVKKINVGIVFEALKTNVFFVQINNSRMNKFMLFISIYFILFLFNEYLFYFLCQPKLLKAKNRNIYQKENEVHVCFTTPRVHSWQRNIYLQRGEGCLSIVPSDP